MYGGSRIEFRANTVNLNFHGTEVAFVFHVAKIEEGKNKETRPSTETTTKQQEDVTPPTKPEETRDGKSPSKHQHRSRKEHLLKIKLPSDKDEMRKRRHSSHRKSREDISQVKLQE